MNKPPVRLLYIFPRTTRDPQERAADHARRLTRLQAAASPGTTVDIRELDNAPPAIETPDDEAVVRPLIRVLAHQLADRYDGIVVGCFSDAGVDEAAESVRIPIIGCGLASFSVALLLGGRIAVLSPTAQTAASVGEITRAAGLHARFVDAVPVGINVREFSADLSHTVRAAMTAGQKAIEAGADVLILGCLSLALTGVGSVLQRQLRIPVVDPTVAGIRTCELLARFGWSPRRRHASSLAGTAIDEPALLE